MMKAPQVFAYQFATQPDAATESSVGAVCLAILDHRNNVDLVVWTVAATADQGLAFRRLQWVIAPRQRGLMQLEEDEYVYRDRRTGEFLSVSAEALTQ